MPISGFSWTAKLIKLHFFIKSLQPRKLILAKIRNMTNSRKLILAKNQNFFNSRKLIPAKISTPKILLFNLFLERLIFVKTSGPGRSTFGPLKFVNYINKSFSEYNTLEAQRCFLLGDFDINLPFKGKEIFSNKITKRCRLWQKKKIVLLYTFSVEQIITSPTRITDRKETCTCTDKIFLLKLANQE